MASLRTLSTNRCQPSAVDRVVVVAAVAAAELVPVQIQPQRDFPIRSYCLGKHEKKDYRKFK